MSGLLEDIEASARPRCNVLRKLAGDPETARDVETLLAMRPKVPYVKISEHLNEMGYKITPTALSKHGRGVCSCG